MPQKSSLPSHLLVIRLSAMGDVAMLAHTLRAMRAAYPEVRITLLTRPLFHPFFEGLGVEFLDFDAKERHKGLLGLKRLAADAHERGIDAIADMHGTLRSAIVATILRMHALSNRAVIDKSRKEKRAALEGGYRRLSAPLKHSVVRYADVLRRLGYTLADPAPAVATPRPNPLGEKSGGRWIGVAPFSAHQGKCYPLDLTRELIAELAKRYECVVVHSGGGEEERFALEMEERYPNVIALFPRLRLAGEMNLIANLDCVVSMDSLVMHMASLTATPVVSLWGATHPALGFLGYGGDERGVVQLDMECRPCSVYGSKPCKYGDYRCMRGIKVATILERIELLIGAKQS